jgi:hypothetical protein
MGPKVYFCCQWKIEVRRQIVELGTQNSIRMMYIIWLRAGLSGRSRQSTNGDRLDRYF